MVSGPLNVGINEWRKVRIRFKAVFRQESGHDCNGSAAVLRY